MKDIGIDRDVQELANNSWDLGANHLAKEIQRQKEKWQEEAFKSARKTCPAYHQSGDDYEYYDYKDFKRVCNK